MLFYPFFKMIKISQCLESPIVGIFNALQYLQFYSAAATPNVAEVEDRVQNESRRRNPPRGRSDSLDKILHGISLNVQVRNGDYPLMIL